MKEWHGKFETIDPKLIVIDHRYQRPTKADLVEAIAANPVWEAFGVPVVFKREGNNAVYYCADGQQRIAGVLASEQPPRQIPVVVFTVTGLEHEAEIFVRINEYRKALTPIEKHTGKVVAKDPAALAIERAVAAAGFTIAKTPSPRAVGAMSALYYAYNLLGENGVTQVLVQIRDAWPDDRKALDANMIRVLAEVIDQQAAGGNGGYSRGKLTQKLVRTSPGSLLRKAEEIHFDTGVSKRAALRRAFKALAKA